MPLILASASPQRKDLLRKAGIPFRAVPSSIEEQNIGNDPKRLVLKLAVDKAREVARRYPDRWVLGADTLVYCRGRILSKPQDERDALSILKTLNGAWQRIYTGVALVHAGKGCVLKGVSVSKAKARSMPEGWLKAYAKKHLDKSGAYSIQHRKDPFIERFIGPLDNIIGLPVGLVRKLLARARHH